MGPSGSGKTTLLNVLANRRAASRAVMRGTISINGVEASTKTLRGVSSYVEQEDALIGSLTVRETLDFAARLSLSRYYTTSSIYALLMAPKRRFHSRAYAKSRRADRRLRSLRPSSQHHRYPNSQRYKRRPETPLEYSLQPYHSPTDPFPRRAYERFRFYGEFRGHQVPKDDCQKAQRVYHISERL